MVPQRKKEDTSGTSEESSWGAKEAALTRLVNPKLLQPDTTRDMHCTQLTIREVDLVLQNLQTGNTRGVDRLQHACGTLPYERPIYRQTRETSCTPCRFEVGGLKLEV